MAARHFQITGQSASEIKQIAKLFREGGIVCLPLDFGYVLSCIVADSPLQKLQSLVGKRQKPTILCPEPKKLFDFVPKTSLQAKKAVQSLWPGPVEMGFECNTSEKPQKLQFSDEVYRFLYQEPIRYFCCPNVPDILKLAEQTVAPILYYPLYDDKQNPIKNINYINRHYSEKIDAIVELLELNFSEKLHTIVHFGAKGMRIIQQGAINKGEILEKATIQILFVCTANTCRSPLAEAYCKRSLCRRLECSLDQLGQFGYNVLSAGVMAAGNMPASAYSAQIASDIGCPLDSHRSRPLTDAMVQEADVIWTMSASHRDEILRRWPTAADKTALLDPKGPIADPIGGDLATYRRCAKQIEQAVEKQLDGIL